MKVMHDHCLQLVLPNDGILKDQKILTEIKAIFRGNKQLTPGGLIELLKELLEEKL